MHSPRFPKALLGAPQTLASHCKGLEEPRLLYGIRFELFPIREAVYYTWVARRSALADVPPSLCQLRGAMRASMTAGARCRSCCQNGWRYAGGGHAASHWICDKHRRCAQVVTTSAQRRATKLSCPSARRRCVSAYDMARGGVPSDRAISSTP